MSPISIAMSGELENAVRQHLFQDRVEQVAFLLAQFSDDEFVINDVMRIARAGFDYQSALHVSLSDEERARVIKWAWDKGGSLVEAHVHLFDEPATFSSTDIGGLREFVPHIWWRLRKRPYAALIYGPESFDGLAWIADAESAEQVSTLRVPGRVERQASGRSLERWYRVPLPND
jgi:hypothetical protein